MPQEVSASALERPNHSPMARPQHHNSQPYPDLQPRPTDYSYPIPKLEHDGSLFDGAGDASLASSTSSTAKAKGKQSTPKAQGSLARGTACSTCRKRKLVRGRSTDQGYRAGCTGAD